MAKLVKHDCCACPLRKCRQMIMIWFICSCLSHQQGYEKLPPSRGEAPTPRLAVSTAPTAPPMGHARMGGSIPKRASIHKEQRG